MSALANYIFELSLLKKFRHIGFSLAGVKNPDSIAEHAHRAAILAYILAKLENYEHPEKVMLMILLHDNAEARITDLHKVATRYITNKKEAELKAYSEQVQDLPAAINEDFLKIFQEYEEKSSTCAIIAKDADILETAFQAKEYVDTGYTAAQDWVDNIGKALKTESAKKLFTEMKSTHCTDWWQGLKKLT